MKSKLVDLDKHRQFPMQIEVVKRVTQTFRTPEWFCNSDEDGAARFLENQYIFFIILSINYLIIILQLRPEVI